MKGPSNPFPEKVRINKLINTRITRTYFPLVLVHKSEAYDAFFFFFFPFTEEEQVCSVVAVFINTINSTSISCVNLPDYPFFISWGL